MQAGHREPRARTRGRQARHPGHKIEGGPTLHLVQAQGRHLRGSLLKLCPLGSLLASPQSQPYSRCPIKTCSDQQNCSGSASEAQTPGGGQLSPFLLSRAPSIFTLSPLGTVPLQNQPPLDPPVPVIPTSWGCACFSRQSNRGLCPWVGGELDQR